MVNAKNDRYLSQWKYLSFFGIACCIGLYIIVVEKLLYEYRPNPPGRLFMTAPQNFCKGAVLFFRLVMQQIQQHIAPDQQDNGAAQDPIHGRQGHLGAEEVQITIDGVLDAFNDFRREPLRLHFRIHPTERMIPQQACAVGAGQEADDLLQTCSELGDGHIGTADKAISGADDGANGGNLTLGGQEEVDDAGERCAEQHQQNHIRQQQEHVPGGHVPAHLCQVEHACTQCQDADDQSADDGGKVIAQRQGGAAHRSHGQIPPGTGHFVLYHEGVAADGYGDATDRQQGGKQFSSGSGVNELLGDVHTLGQGGGKAVPVDLCQECGVQHQQDHGGNQGRKEHGFVLEKQLAVAADQIAQSCHLSIPPVSFLPVTARNTSSIFPLVIS